MSLSCGESSDGRPGPASGGSPNGGSINASGGTASGGKPSGGSVGIGGGSGQSVDCTAVCGHVKVLCKETNAISDVWLDACESACDARVKLTPAVAELEKSCVMAAADCSAAINCVASPR